MTSRPGFLRIAGPHTLLTLLAVALLHYPTARAADPADGTVSPKQRQLLWKGRHYTVTAVTSTSACVPDVEDLDERDHFTLHVDVHKNYWDNHAGGVIVEVRWGGNVDDDFDLCVIDRDTGEVVGASHRDTLLSGAGERVFVERPSGTYDVFVLPFRAVDIGYDGRVEFASRKVRPQDGGVPTEPVFDEKCNGGLAGPFPCQGVDLAAYLPLSHIGAPEGDDLFIHGHANDIWGWVDPETGREYALVGTTAGMAIVDITSQPVYLGMLPTHTPQKTIFAIWRDIKVYKNHAFIVSEEPAHGLQVFDLTRLRGVTQETAWTEDAHYGLFGGAHNIAINEESGFAYVLGSLTCMGGPHMIDIRNPKQPVFAGCVAEDGYTHDAQCVIYRGPDQTYRGREICLLANPGGNLGTLEDRVTIVDVTDKLVPKIVSTLAYANAAITHQGWLTEDHTTFIFGDEGDEITFFLPTTTYLADVSDLDGPVLGGVYTAATEAIDHNMYVKGTTLFQANYRAGLRVLDASAAAEGNLAEIGFFDTFPANDHPEFDGAWSVYPFFPSGKIVVSGIEEGLFVLKQRK